MIQTQYGIRVVFEPTIMVYQQDTDMITQQPSGEPTVLAHTTADVIEQRKQTGGALQVPAVISGMILEAMTDAGLQLAQDVTVLQDLVDQLNENAKPQLRVVPSE